MASEASVTLRVEKTMVDEVDALCERMDAKLRMGGALSRAAVFRMLIDRGMEVLRKEYPPEGESGTPHADDSVP